MTAGSNPFATRYTRPGALEYIFPAGESAEALVARLGKQNWWGAIVGPHGAGKSTLLHTLLPALAAADRQPMLYTLHQNQRTLGIDRSTAAQWNTSTQVIVDGYEQLKWWGRWRLKSLCRRRGAGLLVTAHGSVDIALLYRVVPTPAVALQVVEQLLAGDRQAGDSLETNSPDHRSVVSPADVAAAFERQQGNVREALFELHDLFRKRRSF